MSVATTTSTTIEEPARLLAYGGPINDVKILPSFNVETPIDVLSKHFQEDGVLWMKNIVRRDLVNKFRGDYLRFVDQGSEILKPGTNPEDGIFSGNDWRNYILPGGTRLALGLEDKGPFVENVIKSHVAPFYLDFKDEISKQMAPFVQKLMGFDDPFCLPRSLLRCSVPGAESTPVHYDQIFLRAAPPTSITAWVPIGDIEINGGGLIYLDRSFDIGEKYEQDFAAASEDFTDAEKISHVNRNMNAGGWLDRNLSNFGKNFGRNWLVGKYEAGDIVFHNPYMVHGGATNESPTGRIRVSTDLRFVDKTKPFDQRWNFAAFSDNDPNLARKIKPTGAN